MSKNEYIDSASGALLSSSVELPENLDSRNYLKDAQKKLSKIHNMQLMDLVDYYDFYFSESDFYKKERKTESCTLLLKPALKDVLSRRAWQNRLSLNEYITRVIESYFKNELHLDEDKFI